MPKTTIRSLTRVISHIRPIFNVYCRDPCITPSPCWPGTSSSRRAGRPAVTAALSASQLGAGPTWAACGDDDRLGRGCGRLAARGRCSDLRLVHRRVAGVAMGGVLYRPAFGALTRWHGPNRVRALTTLTLVAGLGQHGVRAVDGGVDRAPGLALDLCCARSHPGRDHDPGALVRVAGAVAAASAGRGGGTRSGSPDSA